jgi:hypothetical protein
MHFFNTDLSRHHYSTLLLYQASNENNEQTNVCGYAPINPRTKTFRPKCRPLTAPNASKDVEQQELPFIAGRIQNGTKRPL